MKRFFAVLGAVCVLGLLFAGLMVRGVIRLNAPSRDRYPVWGVDVSHHQGAIDWPALERQGVRFAYIKATEGSTHTDTRFAENIAAARATGIRAGAYHFFSFESPGATQAENFLEAVPQFDGALPMAVDFEYYGDWAKNPPPVDAMRAELRALIGAIEAERGVKPVIYATESAYRRYIKGAFDDCDLWIRSVYLPPWGHDWTFWQYSDVGLLEGYTGPEERIDLNVFYGSEEEFKAYGL